MQGRAVLMVNDVRLWGALSAACAPCARSTKHGATLCFTGRRPEGCFAGETEAKLQVPIHRREATRPVHRCRHCFWLQLGV